MSISKPAINDKGDYPTLQKLYEFFSPRCKTLEVWSFGLGNGLFETELIETLGCSVKLYDAREGKEDLFNEINTICETHETKREEGWAQQIAKRWLLPKKLLFSKVLPWIFSGTVDISGQQTQLSKINTNEVQRLDICKIEYSGLTSSILINILQEGYRPGLFYIHWDKHPDQYTDSMLAAGHLQTSGYALIGVK